MRIQSSWSCAMDRRTSSRGSWPQPAVIATNATSACFAGLTVDLTVAGGTQITLYNGRIHATTGASASRGRVCPHLPDLAVAREGNASTRHSLARARHADRRFPQGRREEADHLRTTDRDRGPG